MNIKIKLALEVMRAKLAEVRFVPDNGVGMAYSVEAGPAREKSIDGRRDML